MLVSVMAVEERQRFGLIRNEATRIALALFAELGAINDNTFEQFIERWLVIWVGILDAVVDSQAGYLEAWGLANDIDLDAAVPTPVPRGRPPEVTYRRPWTTYYRELAAGKTPAIAALAARDRLKRLIGSDMQLVRRDAATTALAASPERIVGYRRVLGAGNNCGLCIVASTQRYHKADLRPIHDLCGCGVEPLIGTKTPPRIINGDRLKVIKAELDGAPYSRSALARLRLDVKDLPEVTVRIHGELGPVLTDSRHHFTGPDELGIAS